MSESKQFVELHDVRSDTTTELVMGWADLSWQDMGPVRATFRAWPGTMFWIGAALLIIAQPILAYTLSPDPDDDLWLSIVFAANWLFWLSWFWVPGALERHRVCEHGLIVGFRTKSQYVIPWSTIDPGRVRVVNRSPLLGRVTDRPTSSPHYRTSFFVTRALAVNGLDSTIGARWPHIPGIIEVADASPGTTIRPTPFVWWILGGRHPERLAQAIEDAMIADGYPAHGLAARATAQAHTTRWNPGTHNPLPTRQATDPILGADGPPLP